MLTMLIDVVLFILLMPAMLLWVIWQMIEDIREFFGNWIFPAALSIYGSVTLFIIGPAEPDAAFESVFNWLSESIVLGMRLPLLLLLLGVAMLAAGASRRYWQRSEARQSSIGNKLES
jgi:hypothetical protein